MYFGSSLLYSSYEERCLNFFLPFEVSVVMAKVIIRQQHEQVLSMTSSTASYEWAELYNSMHNTVSLIQASFFIAGLNSLTAAYTSDSSTKVACNISDHLPNIISCTA